MVRKYNINCLGYAQKKTFDFFFSLTAFADFGSILGVFFGCSFLSIAEIFHILIVLLMKKFSSIRLKIDESNIFHQSTIHGVKFILDSKRPSFIRIFWLFAFLTSISFCFFYIRESYVKLAIEPELDTSLIQKSTYEVPFPAITICTNVFAKNHLANVSHFLEKVNKEKRLNITTEETKFLIANMHRFSPNLIGTIRRLTKFNQTFNIVDYLHKSQFDIKELMHSCAIAEKPVDCSRYFQRVLTFKGVCFAFNQRSYQSIFRNGISHDFILKPLQRQKISEWNLDEGYQTTKSSTFPLRAENTKLSLTLKITDQDASNVYRGKKIYAYFHKPNEIISSSTYSKAINFNQENIFLVQAKSFKYSNDFQKFSPKNRGCFFTEERNLTYIKYYTQNNCLEECLAWLVSLVCKCVKFSMPRNETISVCNLDLSPNCYDTLTLAFPPSKAIGIPPCGCLKTCNDIQYSIKRTIKILDKSQKEFVNKLNRYI